MAKSEFSLTSFILTRLLIAFTVVIAVVIGVALGLSMAETSNIRNQENFLDFAPALPTRILDINGNLVTEYSADEKRELVALSDLPRHLINAIVCREDPNFFNHKGFSIRGIARATYGQLTGQNLGGGSTITQQIAGTLYTDRTEQTLSRKIRELWWALQMERRFSKNEILEIYLNQINMGPGVFGVEASSQYFFGHSARDVTLAEAAILAILPSSPARYNPLNNPNDARNRQLAVLERMIEFGYTNRDNAERSFNEYWDNYDYTRQSVAAYFHREDAAPWFSEYVRRELEGMMYGTMDYYRDGLTVHTTLNLRHQEAATRFMEEGLVRANREYTRASTNSNIQAQRTYIPIVELLALAFDLQGIHLASSVQSEQRARSHYTSVINPVVDLAALVFGISDLKPLTNTSFATLRTSTERNVVEGALISIENETGYITAIIGGSRYDESNQLIRATQGSLQPGSAFKPLYYSAAIDSRILTPGSLITDVPIVFHNEDGTPYLPLNFRGEWRGSVLLYDALAQSMNVPSLKVLDTIGFDAAIDRSASLLGHTNPDFIERNFPRVYPLGLGIISTSPIRMARAFAVFGNQGREVTPIAIRYVEDRNGRVVLNPEQEIRQDQRRIGTAIQTVSPQNAYIMTSMLIQTVEKGTLYNPSGWLSKFTFLDEEGRRFRMPMAGKTGTPQNWSDAWTVGYSPYYTTAVWFGFDRPGNSLGVNLTGSTLAGPVWADYMREIHHGLPFRDFARPSTGLINVAVCTSSGLLRNPACNQGEVTLTFLEGTQPGQLCNVHGNTGHADMILSTRFSMDTMTLNERNIVENLRMPTLAPEFLLDSAPAASTIQAPTSSPVISSPPIEISTPVSSPTETTAPETFTIDDTEDEEEEEEESFFFELELPDYNPLLD